MWFIPLVSPLNLYLRLFRVASCACSHIGLYCGLFLPNTKISSVYFNGIVRDMQGRKMSKSLGNGGDPIEMSEKYGADALRMFYAMSTAPGTDCKLDENKIKGFKHFSNKF